MEIKIKNMNNINDFNMNNGRCLKCGKELDRFNFTDYCKYCQNILNEEIKKQKELEHFKNLKKYSIEERIQIIEKWIYNHS